MEELQELVVIQNGSAQEAAETGDKAEPPRSELTVDEIIEEHVGAFGFSQIVHVFLVSLSWLFDAQTTLVTIFSDAQPAWRCTAAAGSSASSCHRGSEGAATVMCGLDRGAWEWIGGNGTSTIAEWDLVCGKKFTAGIPASLFFLGSVFGSAVHGRLADAYLGRRKTILVSCVLASVTAYLTSLSQNVWVYALLRFCSGFARAGIGICCLVLSTEVVGRNWRGQVGQYGFFFFTLGLLSLPMIAYPARASWRTLYKVVSLPPLVYSLLVIPFISESPRWLAVKGRKEEAMEVLAKLARSNGRNLPANLSIGNSTDSKSTGTGAAGASGSLLSARWATRMATLMIAGFGVGFVYYGLQLNAENLNFNLYLAVAMNALMEVPAVFLGSVFLGVANRRALFSSSACGAGIACILCILFSKATTNPGGNWGQLTVEACGFMAVSMAFDVLYVYCVELFPTNVRSFAVSMLRQAMMLGAAIAPLMVVVGRLSPSMSFLVFGVLSMFSGMVTLWLPETKNAPLYETLEHQEMEENWGSCHNREGQELDSVP